MNKALEELINICNKLEMTIMNYYIYTTVNESPSAVVQDKLGNISSLYYEDEIWC